MPTDARPIIAVATGDPAGIGTEISMKAALDPGVRARYRPVLVGDPTLVARHAQACGIGADLQIIDTIDAAKSANRAIIAPPNTPQVIVAKLNAAVEEMLKSEHAKDIFAKINLHAAGGTPAEAATFIKEQTKPWDGVIKATHVQPH